MNKCSLDKDISDCDILRISLNEVSKVDEDINQDSQEKLKDLSIKNPDQDTEAIAYELHEQNTIECAELSKNVIVQTSSDSNFGSREIKPKNPNNWTIPSCITNWKNAKGYTIPLHMRTSANRINLAQIKQPEKFIELSESLYIAEQEARKEIASRNSYLKSENIAKNNDLNKP